MGPKNNGKQWTSTELNDLRQLANGNTPTRVIALKLHRTPAAVQSKATTEQSPYNRRKA